MAVRPIPEGYGSVTPYLCCRNAAAALDFYKHVFGATEVMRMAQPDGKIGHAEIKIGGDVIMLADEFPDYGVRSPQAFGGSPVSMYLYVADVDAVVKRATAAGAKLLRPVEDQFYGDRSGRVEDPFGHVWQVATHTEDLTKEEIARRAAESMKQQG